MNSISTESRRAGLMDAYRATRSKLNQLLANAGGNDVAALEGIRRLTEQLNEIKEHYRQSVPIVPLSRCPIGNGVLAHSLDVFGLDGLWWDYEDPVRPVESLPRTYFALTGAVIPGDSIEDCHFLCRPGAAAPYIVPRLLRHPNVKAVLSYVVIGKHHGFAITYFASPTPYDIDRVNTWGAGHYLAPNAEGRLLRGTAELSSADVDFDLEPWIVAGKLLWIAPRDASLALKDSLVDCPYLRLARGAGFYKTYNGQISPEATAQTNAAPSPPQSVPMPQKTQPSPIACPACGASNPPGKKFCGDCGHTLAAQAAPSPETLQRPSSMNAPASSTIEQRGAPETTAPTMTVRNWLRSLAPRETRTASVELAHLQALAVALGHARENKLISPEKLTAVHRLVQARGPENKIWTVGLASLRWNQLSNDEWRPADLPDWLSLDSAMLESVASLSAGEPVSTAPASRAAPDQGLTCPTCGTRLRPDAKFCHIDGTPVVPGPIRSASRDIPGSASTSEMPGEVKPVEQGRRAPERDEK